MNDTLKAERYTKYQLASTVLTFKKDVAVNLLEISTLLFP